MKKPNERWLILLIIAMGASLLFYGDKKMVGIAVVSYAAMWLWLIVHHAKKEDWYDQRSFKRQK